MASRIIADVCSSLTLAPVRVKFAPAPNQKISWEAGEAARGKDLKGLIKKASEYVSVAVNKMVQFRQNRSFTKSTLSKHCSCQLDQTWWDKTRR